MQQNAYSKDWETRCDSNIPGRVRIGISILKKNENLCSELAQKLSKAPGIRMASASPFTARVLVVYDYNMITYKNLQSLINSIITDKQAVKGKLAKKSNIIRADFRHKRVLGIKEFSSCRNVLSKEYYKYNAKALFPVAPTLKDAAQDWHTPSVGEIEKRLDTDTEAGLTIRKLDERLRKYGFNEMAKKQRKPFVSLLFNQFKEFVIKLLLAAGAISIALGQVLDGAAILGIVGLEATLGAWQEYNAEKSLEALREMSAPYSYAIRDGKKLEINPRYIVPGDVICLEAGNKVPADARLVRCNNLEVVESALTGESSAVQKKCGGLDELEIPVGDRTNMVYAGTFVTKGNAEAVVVSTGMDTEMGKIAESLGSVETEKTPLQKDLDRLAKVVSWACIGVCGIITLGGIIGGHPPGSMLATGVSLAVGAIPEGLSTVLVISLAFGAQRMAKKNAVVKNLPSVETLGCAGVICTDKTGTLTTNEMTVKEIFTASSRVHVHGEGYNNQGEFICEGGKISAQNRNDIKMLLTAAALCNNSEITEAGKGSFDVKGDPTEAALLIAIRKSDVVLEDFQCFKREHEVPFDPESKRMTAICSDREGRCFAFTKGAADTVLGRCTKILTTDGELDLTEDYALRLTIEIEGMAERGLRVLGFAYKPFEGDTERFDDAFYDASVDSGMVFLGFVGMMDPPRPGIKEAIKKCHDAGIKVVMITGDHKKTALTIAKDIGLLTGHGTVLGGDELERMSDSALEDMIDDVQVFARTCPQQKLKIVKALKKRGYVVAMTGDGINDAPALKEAHIGIAMGKSGTDVTKEASSIILTDDNFNTIVKAVEEGRTINRNIRKFVKYVLSGNLAEVLLIFTASVIGLPAPMVPAQILMLNLVTESIPALSLGVDPADGDVMKESPGRLGRSVFDRRSALSILKRGTVTGIVSLGMFGAALYGTGNVAVARSAAFASLVTSQMLHAFDSSSKGKVRNKYLLPSIGISTGVMLASIYVAPLSSLLGMAPIGIIGWAGILAAALVIGRVADGRQLSISYNKACFKN